MLDGGEGRGDEDAGEDEREADRGEDGGVYVSRVRPDRDDVWLLGEQRTEASDAGVADRIKSILDGGDASGEDGREGDGEEDVYVSRV